MSNWYIELAHPHWQLNQLKAALRAWLQFNSSLLGNVSIEEHDWHAVSNKEKNAKDLLALRKTMTEPEYVKEQALRVQISSFPQQVRLHLAFNDEKVQPRQWVLLERQLLAFYQQAQLSLTPAATLAIPSAENDFWQQQAMSSPAAPQLSTRRNVLPEYIYTHRYATLPKSEYKNLQAIADEAKLSLTVVVLTMMSDLLQQHSRSPWFRINLTLLNRLPVYPYQSDRASYATTLTTLPLETADGVSFLDRAKAFDKQLRISNLHLNRNALPPLNKADMQAQDVTPLLLTCQLEQSLSHNDKAFYSEPANIMYYHGFQPKPEFMVDIWEQNGELHYRWSFIKELAEVVDGKIFPQFSRSIKTTAAAVVGAVTAATVVQTALAKSTQAPNLVSNIKMPLQQKQASLAEQDQGQTPVSIAELQLGTADVSAAAEEEKSSALEPLEKMLDAIEGVEQSNFELMNPAEKMVPPLTAASVAGLGGPAIADLCKKQQIKLAEEHNKQSPATENHNEAVIQFYELINNSRQHCQQQPYFDDFKNIDDNLAEICGLMLIGELEQAKQKIELSKQYMQSLKTKLEQAPYPELPDDPLSKGLGDMETQVQALKQEIPTYIQADVPDPGILSKLTALDKLISGFAMVTKGDFAKLIKHAGKDLGSAAQRAQEEKAKAEAQANALSDKAVDQLNSEQAENIKASMARAQSIKESGEQIAGMSCADMQKQAGELALKKFGGQIDDVKNSLPIPAGEKLILDNINQLEGNIKELENYYDAANKLDPEALARAKAAELQGAAVSGVTQQKEFQLIQNATDSGQGLYKNVEEQVCQKDTSSLLAGKCGTKLEFADPYRSYISYASSLQGDVENEIAYVETTKAKLIAQQQAAKDQAHGMKDNAQEQARLMREKAEQDKRNMESKEYRDAKQAEYKQAAKDKAQEAKEYAKGAATNIAMGTDTAKHIQESISFLDQCKATFENLKSTLESTMKMWETAAPPTKAMVKDSAKEIFNQYSPVPMGDGKTMTMAEATQMARKAAFEQSNAVKDKVTGCVQHNQGKMNGYLAMLPTKEDLDMYLNPAKEFDARKLLSDKMKLVQEKLSNEIANAKGAAKQKLVDLANKVARSTSCVESGLLESPPPSKVVVVSGATAKCQWGKAEVPIIVPVGNCDVNGRLVVQNTTAKFASPFGICESRGNPQVLEAEAKSKATGTPPVPVPCIPPPTLSFKRVTSVYLVNGQPVVQKGAQMGCPRGMPPVVGNVITIQNSGQKDLPEFEAD